MKEFALLSVSQILCIFSSPKQLEITNSFSECIIILDHILLLKKFPHFHESRFDVKSKF